MMIKRKLGSYPWIASVVTHARLRHERLYSVDGDIFELTFTYYQNNTDIDLGIGMDVIFSMDDPDLRIVFENDGTGIDCVTADVNGAYLNFWTASDASMVDQLFSTEREVDWVKEGF